MRKIVLTFGLIAGAIMSAMMLITLPFHDEIGFDKSAVIGYTTMVLAFLMVFFGVKSYRDNVAAGSVTFWRALTVGLMITAVASVCYVATWELVGRRMAPDYVEKYAAYEVDKLRKSGASETEVAAKAKEMREFNEMYKKPLNNIALTLIEPLPVGILLTLIAAGVLSRKRRPKMNEAGDFSPAPSNNL